MEKIFKSKKIILLVMILSAVTFAVACISTYVIYRTSTESLKSSLVDIAEGERALIESLIEHSISKDSILITINSAHHTKQAIGKSGEFVIAELVHDSINFLLREDITGYITNIKIPVQSAIGTPISMAVKGQSGSAKAKDYSGTEVYAGYTYIDSLKWGIVAKIDTAEFNKSFYFALYIALGLALILVFFGALLFIKITNPMLASITENEIRYRRVFEAAKDGIIILDADTGKIIDTNPSLIEMLGYSSKNLVAIEIWKISAFKKMGYTKDTFIELQNKGLERFNNVLLEKKDGRIINADVISNIYQVGRNKVVQFNVRDITQKKKDEANLFAERERLSVTLHSIGDAVITTDTKGNIDFLNNVAEQLTGWKLEDATGKPLPEVFYIINEQTRELCDNPAEIVLNSGATVDLANHTILIARNGSERVIADSGSPIRDIEGKVFGVVLVFRDVTEKHIAEMQLKESEEKYHSLFENMIDGYAFCKMIYENGNPVDFIYLDVNSSFEKLTGLKDVTGKKVTEVIPGINKSDSKLIETYGRVSTTGQHERFEMFVEALNDWYSVSVYSTKKDYFVAVFEVITNRKLSEELLKDSEIRYRRLFEASKDGILILDDYNGQIQDVNPYLTDMLGYTLEELLGKEVWEIEVFKNITASKEDFIELKEKELTRFEHMSLLAKDGRQINVEFVSYVYLVDHAKVIQCNIREISDNKKSEEALKESEMKLRAITKSAKDAIIMINDNGNVTFWNPAAEEIFGYSSFEIHGKNLHDIIMPASLMQKHLTAFMKWKETGDGNAIDKTMEVIAIRKNGQEFPVELSLSSVRLHERWMAVGIVRDITRRKMADEALKDSEKRYIELNATKDKFFSIIAHDLRNPFGTFKQTLDLLSDEYYEFDEKERIEFITLMKNSSKHLLELLENLLTWSRSQRGNIEYQPINFEIKTIINNSISLFNQNAIAKKIELLSEVSPGIVCYADINMLTTVVRNLISNAIKFTGNGGKIVISTDDFSDEQNIIIKVADNGVGIPPEIQQKLFRIDTHVTSLGTNEEKGTGLGLILCKEFVERYGGRIWVDSEPGKGSTFYFTVSKGK
jgi:PAS domain S-box-containing protein